MEKSDAKKVLLMMSTADNECSSCVKELFQLFIQEYPVFREQAEKIYVDLFGKTMDEVEE